MEWYNKILAVTFRELTEANPDGEVVTTKSNYDWLSRENKINILRPGKGLATPALIEYESLPQRFKERFCRIWGDPYKMIQESMMKDEIITDIRARDFFAEHRLPCGSAIPDEFQAEYVRNASVLNMLVNILGKRTAMRNAMNNPIGTLWETVYGTVDKLRTSPGHTLPKSRERLRDKINEYRKKGYECLISGKLGNKNTLKITEEGGTFIVMQKRRRVPVMSDVMIMAEYNRVAPDYNWKPLDCVESVTSFLNAPENVQRWYDAVYGELEAYRKFGYKFRTSLPEYRDSLWYGDGTKLNLYYKAYEKGKLVMKTIQVYEVMDAYSEMLLGYHICENENYTAQYNAYRMAVETAEARPFEIVVDNQGGHKKEENQAFLKRITRLQRFTTPYRATAKSIEAVFGRFQTQILHKDWRCTGQNITAKSQKSRANLEFILANPENLYTLTELHEAYAKAREEWNAAPHPATGMARQDMYFASVNPEAQPLDKLDLIEAFWLMTPKPATFTASGIEIQINKKKYAYDVYTPDGLPDLNFRKKNIGRKFFTQYDPNDLTQVRLYVMEASGLRYITDATPYAKVQRAVQEATDESSSFIRRVQDLDEQIRIATYFDNINTEHEYGVAPEQFGLNRPAPKGITKTAKMAMEASGMIVPRKKAKRHRPLEIGVLEKEMSNGVYGELEYSELHQLDKC